MDDDLSYLRLDRSILLLRIATMYSALSELEWIRLLVWTVPQREHDDNCPSLV